MLSMKEDSVRTDVLSLTKAMKTLLSNHILRVHTKTHIHTHTQLILLRVNKVVMLMINCILEFSIKYY